MAKQYAARKPNKLTSVSAWHDLARNRFFYGLLTFLIAAGIVIYFFGSGPGTGSGAPGAGGQDTAFTVNGIAIKHADVDNAFENVKQLAGGSDTMSATYQGMMLGQMIDQAILRSAAKKAGLTVSDADVDKQIAQMKQRPGPDGKPMTDNQWQALLAQQGISEDQLRDQLREGLLAKVYMDTIAAKQNVTYDDLLKSYDEIKVRHILIPTIGGPRPIPGAMPDAQAKHRAEQILAKVKANPADFAKLANEYSMDPSNKAPHFDPKTKKTVTEAKGGDLGDPSNGDWYKRGGGFDSTFEDAAFALKPGQVSDLVKTPFGYHIIKVDDYRRDLPKDFDKNKAQLLQDLKQQRAQKPQQEFLTEARKTAKIVWKDPSLKWRYDYSKLSNPMMGMMQPPSANQAADEQAFMDELKAYAAKNPDDPAAQLILGQKLDQQLMMASLPIPGHKQAAPASAQTAKLRDEVINAYTAALKHTEDQQARMRLAQLYEDAKQPDKALDQYKQIQKNISWDDASSNKMVHMQLVSAFKKLGHADLAAEEQKQVDKANAEEAQTRKEQEAAAKAARAAKPGAGASGAAGVTTTPGGTITVAPSPAGGAVKTQSNGAQSKGGAAKQ